MIYERKSAAGSWTKSKSPKTAFAALTLSLAAGLFAACGQTVSADTRVDADATTESTPAAEAPGEAAENDGTARSARAFTCESQNPAEPEIVTLILRQEKGWLASFSECPAGADAPCGGVQVATEPTEEEGWINHYQKGFERLMLQIELEPQADGSFRGKRPTRDNEYICTAEF